MSISSSFSSPQPPSKPAQAATPFEANGNPINAEAASSAEAAPAPSMEATDSLSLNKGGSSQPPPPSATKFGGGVKPNVWQRFMNWLSDLFNIGTNAAKHTVSTPKPHKAKLFGPEEAPAGYQVLPPEEAKKSIASMLKKALFIGAAAGGALVFRKEIGQFAHQYVPAAIKNPAKRFSGWISGLMPAMVKKGFGSASDIACNQADTVRNLGISVGKGGMQRITSAKKSGPGFFKDFWNSFKKG